VHAKQFDGSAPPRPTGGVSALSAPIAGLRVCGPHEMKGKGEEMVEREGEKPGEDCERKGNKNKEEAWGEKRGRKE